MPLSNHYAHAANLKVADFVLAEHRYRYDAQYDDSTGEATMHMSRFKAAVAAAPYKKGEMILVVYGEGYARAYIHHVTAERDAYGDWRVVYLVSRETKAGVFSKRPYNVHPGQVQRGYLRAGLAPEKT